MLGLYEPLQAGSILADRPPNRQLSKTATRHAMAFSPTSRTAQKTVSFRPAFRCYQHVVRFGLTLSLPAPTSKDLRVPLGVLRPFALTKDWHPTPESRKQKITQMRNFLGITYWNNLCISCGEVGFDPYSQRLGTLGITSPIICVLWVASGLPGPRWPPIARSGYRLRHG
jgi:hypothetical protein